MSREGDTSFAAKFFQHRPDLRGEIDNSTHFQEWKNRFRTVIVDNIPYFVVGGDMLKDEDELALDFAREFGIVSDDLLGRMQEDDT